jgi:type I restriction enzyme M protein
LVVNKNKPDELRNKILFINADAEYAEGKNQNKLRPEDIEKIDFVFTKKMKIPKYSRLVKVQEIIEKHDINLNIRRYVDNTPEPEPEDVTAHLIGGVPVVEVRAKKAVLEKLGINQAVLLQPDRTGYLVFKPEISEKQQIKTTIENDSNVQQTIKKMHSETEAWWQKAKDDFSRLPKKNNGNENNLSRVRSELLESLKAILPPIGVLDEFQTAGVFVNWWQNIRYDLKTIVNMGWNHILIPDDYMIDAYFRAEVYEIEKLEAQQGEKESELAEALEAVEYEPEEEEKVTARVLKVHLQAMITDFTDATGETAAKERKVYQQQLDAIQQLEKEIKVIKKNIKDKRFEMDIKLSLKRVGDEEEKADTRQLLKQADDQIARLDVNNKEDKKKINALNNDKKVLNERLQRIDDLWKEVGQKITDAECQTLILKKLYDMISHELKRYLNAEKRQLVGVFENLWDKYAVSSRQLEAKRSETLKQLNVFFDELGYLR